MNYAAIISAALELAKSLIQTGIEYYQASQSDQAALVAKAEADFQACLKTITGLDAQIAANNAAADAAAQAKPQ